MMALLKIVGIWSFFFSLAYAQQHSDLVKMQAKIFKDKDQKAYLALYFKNKEGWHTYWKNPGDAGTPFKHSFKLDQTPLPLESLEWPAPHRYMEQGDLQAYGYEGTYGFFFPLPSDPQMKGKTLTIFSQWLVCKHICIPGQKEIKGKIQNEQLVLSPGEIEELTLSSQEEETLFSSLPAKVPFPETLLQLETVRSENGKNLVLYYSLKGVSPSSISPDRNLLTPFPQNILTFHHEELSWDKINQTVYGKMEVDWDGEYAEGGPVALPADGKFKKPLALHFLFHNPVNQKVEVIVRDLTHLLKEGPLQKAFLMAKKVDIKLSQLDRQPNDNGTALLEEKKNFENAESAGNFLFHLLLAFLGGVILNFMPCVLPVISLKLFGMVKMAKATPRKIFLHNFFYMVGVVVTFLLLGGVVLLLKQGGEEVGWGFHLQSPGFVGTMILILFLLALNLFGLFEFRTPGGKFLGETPVKGGHTGDFFSGMLSTLLATPCSAPFLGTALTFAFTSPPYVIMMIFFMMGLGLSLPFIVTGFFPQLVALLPRPGAWMENLKKFLALAILLTLVWLYDVFLSLVDSSWPTLLMNLALIFSFFAFYYQKHIGAKAGGKALFFALSLLPVVFLFLNLRQGENPNSSTVTSEIPWNKWSREALQEQLAKKNLVFMDFTAKWCFTCKVNEKLVLSTSGFSDLAGKYGVHLLLADWTKRDPVIGGWLKEQNIFGVPAYFIQDRQGKIHSLGETITLGEIERKLQELQNP